MIKTSDRYKNKILNAKTNNGVIMNNNVEKFIDDNGAMEVKQVPRLNHKQRREIEKIMIKETFKSNELIEFKKLSRKELNARIRNSLKQFACNNEAGEYRMHIDLTDSSIKDCFKNFDNPNFVVSEKDDNFYFVRPKEQTKAERQTEVYQLEQLLDILKGSKKPEVTFVVKTDKDYKQKIYVYDGQHRLLLVVDFMFFGKSFSVQSLKKALQEKETLFTDKNLWPDVWKSFDQFVNTFDGESFNFEQLINHQPEMKSVFEDKEKMIVYGNLHLCDSKTASLLFRKLNEHVSSHSTTQRVKSDLSETEFSELLFGSKLTISDSLVGYLSDVVPHIPFFNRKEVDFPSGITKKFSYDTSSDEQNQMNFDQYLIYVYQMILSRVKREMIANDDGEQKLIYKFDVKCNPTDSELWGGEPFDNSAWTTYGIKPKMYDFWIERFSNLVIDDKKIFVEFVENILKIALLTTSDDFLNRVIRWAKCLDKLKKPHTDEIKKIKNKYPNEDVTPVDVLKELKDFKYYSDCLELHKVKYHDQFVVFSTLSLHSYLKKFKLEDWIIGKLDCMINTFDDIVKAQEDKINGHVSKIGQKRGTKNRGNFLFKNYGVSNFQTIISEYIQSMDESLWSRSEAETYFEEVLEHTDDYLYICPHSCKPVTKDNFHSHHLHFRSSDNPHKELKYWFPLSPEFNQFISDNPQKNIIDTETDGTFIDACNTLIDMMKTKSNTTSNVKEKLGWKKSIQTLDMWKDMMEVYLNNE